MKRLAVGIESNLEHQGKRRMGENFEQLPDEVILNILKYLDIKDLGRCAKTCKRFQNVSHDESLWKKINLSWNKRIPPRFLEQILANGCLYLNLRRARISGSSQGFNLKNINVKLKYLDFGYGSWIKNEERVFEEITASCRFLEKLSLSGQGTLSLKVIENICQNGQTLKVLDLHKCEELHFEEIKCIVTNCKGLVELNLDNYHRWTTVFDERSLCAESINFICENLTESIRKLSLFNQDNITDSHVETLLIRCNKITEFTISSIDITCNVATYISKYLSNTLVKLGLDYMHVNAMRIFSKLNELSMSKLEYVCVPNCPQEYYEDLKVVFPSSKLADKCSHIALSYKDEEETPTFRFWDVHAKQIDLFSIVKPSEEEADD